MPTKEKHDPLSIAARLIGVTVEHDDIAGPVDPFEVTRMLRELHEHRRSLSEAHEEIARLERKIALLEECRLVLRVLVHDAWGPVTSSGDIQWQCVRRHDLDRGREVLTAYEIGTGEEGKP